MNDFKIKVGILSDLPKVVSGLSGAVDSLEKRLSAVKGSAYVESLFRAHDIPTGPPIVRDLQKLGVLSFELGGLGQSHSATASPNNEAAEIMLRLKALAPGRERAEYIASLGKNIDGPTRDFLSRYVDVAEHQDNGKGSLLEQYKAIGDYRERTKFLLAHGGSIDALLTTTKR